MCAGEAEAGGDEAVVAVGAAEGAPAEERQQDALEEAAAVGTVDSAAAALRTNLLAALGWLLVGHG